MSIFSADNFLNWGRIAACRMQSSLGTVPFQVIDFLYLLLYPRTQGASESEYQIDLEAFASANFPMFKVHGFLHICYACDRSTSHMIQKVLSLKNCPAANFLWISEMQFG
jgi:hypothetical protein